MRVHVSLDERSYEEKPKGKEIIGVKRRCCDNWQEVELRELADLVGNSGHAIVPGHMVGGMKSENCTGMELFALDFDDGTTFEEVKCKCNQIGLPIAFAYHTYSSSETEERFRVVFVHECLIRDLFVIRVALGMLYKIFPDCDRACKNPDLFLGGKKLIYVDDREESRFALVKLLTPFYDALSNQGHLAREIRSFCSQYNVLNTQNRLAFYPYGYYPTFEHDFGEIVDPAINHIIAQSTKSPFFIIEDKSQVKDSLHSSQTCQKKYRRLNVQEISNCQLLNDFNAGYDLSHDAKFAILLNLLQINGGRKHFFRILKEFYSMESVQKWERDIKYMSHYQPMRCSSDFCTYYDQCEQCGTIIKTLSTDRKVYRKKEQLCTVEEAFDVLYHNLEKAIVSPVRGMHLIRAQTAMGKTEAYCKLIASHPERKFLIALPTNRLKNDVYSRLTDNSKGKMPIESVFMTLSVHDHWSDGPIVPPEIQDKVSEYHEKGIHNMTKKVLNEYYEEIKDNPDISKEYKERLEVLKKGIRAVEEQRVIVTTHASFNQMQEDFLKDYCIIIDEDILYLDYLNRTHRISENTVKKLLEKNVFGFHDIAAEIINTPLND